MSKMSTANLRNHMHSKIKRIEVKRIHAPVVADFTFLSVLFENSFTSDIKILDHQSGCKKSLEKLLQYPYFCHDYLTQLCFIY